MNPFHHAGRYKHHWGFTLIEMAVVLVISGLMMRYLLQIDQFVTAGDCYITTRTAIDQFAHKNDRLPLPAPRNVNIASSSYGREVSSAQITAGAIDQVGGTSWGALPFQTLGLRVAAAGDCWGNKITYVVTTALTTNTSSGGFSIRPFRVISPSKAVQPSWSARLVPMPLSAMARTRWGQ